MRLKSVGLSSHVIHWFKNYLSGRTQCVQAEGKISDSLEIAKGILQGSVLGPLLFTIYINSLDYDIQEANFNFYADDSVMYCSDSSGQQALNELQSAFDVIQSRLYNLKLVLNADTRVSCVLFWMLNACVFAHTWRIKMILILILILIKPSICYFQVQKILKIIQFLFRPCTVIELVKE